MSTAQISSENQRAREAARDEHGRFGSWTSAESTATLAPDDPQIEDQEPEAHHEVQYSFLAEFEARQEQFDLDFEGYPKRFFTSNLRGSIRKYRGIQLWQEGRYSVREDYIDPGVELDDYTERLSSDEDAHLQLRYFHHRTVAGRLFKSAASTSDNAMSDEDAEAMLHRLPDVDSVERINPDSSLLRGLSKKAQRGWIVETQGQEGHTAVLAITDGPDRDFRQAAFRRSPPPLKSGQVFTQTDLRSLAGNERIQRKTGYDLLTSLSHTDGSKDLEAINTGSKIEVLQAVAAMEDSQTEGRNFLAQKKHVRESTGRVATVWTDKKSPDQTHRQMMETTSLAASNGGDFRSVEIDNDVDPDMYADFESAYNEIAHRLPRLSAARRPEIRIRKLGKHGSATSEVNGLFNPARNAVAVDVSTSESFIHEMGHHYDLVAKNNASLSADFKSVTRAYSRSLDEDDVSHREYLTTPTEVMARGFERYAVERLGVRNRLVNPSKFDRSDYEPFNDPQLKDETFAFFDKLFADDRR